MTADEGFNTGDVVVELGKNVPKFVYDQLDGEVGCRLPGKDRNGLQQVRWYRAELLELKVRAN